MELAEDEARANGRRAVEETYNWERSGRTLRECYRKLQDGIAARERNTELSTV